MKSRTRLSKLPARATASIPTFHFPPQLNQGERQMFTNGKALTAARCREQTARGCNQGRQAPGPRQSGGRESEVPPRRRRHEQHGGRLRGPDQRDCRVRGPDLQGRHPAEDHRHLQRRLQRDQEQPQRLHRRDERLAAGDEDADPGDPGRQAADARQRASSLPAAGASWWAA